MQANTDATLDVILSEWHHWQSVQPVTRGFNTRALVCGDYPISNQYDGDDIIDAKINRRRMAAVNAQAQDMADPWRAAIYTQARQLCTGVAVWSHARLPADKDRLAAVVCEARAMMTRRLQSVGVM